MNDLSLINTFFKENNFNPSKKMGQNFLINKNICMQMVSKIEINITSNISSIIEIGPGLGALTELLINKCNRLTVIELDKRLADFIKRKYGNIEVINNDILNVDLDKISTNNTILVSNLPYSISSLVFIKFLKSKLNVFYCMIQKEMADRILAKPSSKKFNSFTVIINYCCAVERLLNVNRNNFFPSPNVDSVVIKLIKKNNYDKLFDNFISLCFASKRQTLYNNLKKKYDKEKISNILFKFNLDQKIRAEAIDINTLHNIFCYLVIK
ncbi:MAG: 16S rRNA (adenine(1518)-N(6)/adenine(1519)-N(6))-dimethyltransferase RsmA [Mycoplasmataceae bacterium]|jgi:16S rRNA (adenine1518-N6/adenine1519-N6)-dimethyltransferase|nr:16S rRNA (adenine(1518)-N(6)/adenine(1519)-N(6))-dimethyltransferase RsmA [Mycoplasmataceae bacterium]